jgi:predicted dehydrogenase
VQQDKMGNLKIGIIGCGAVTRRHHLPVLMANSKAEVTALCDQNIEAAKTIRRRFNLSCQIFDKAEEFFENGNMDIVDICTPGNTHFDLAQRAIESGKHIIIEKPPVMKIEEAELLIEIAKTRGLKIGTIFNNRYRHILDKLCQMIKSGMLGSLIKVNVLHHASLVYGDAPWLWNEKVSRYLVYEFGIHFFDFVVSLLGEHEAVIHVIPFYQPTINQTTEIHVAIKFRSGAFANFTIAQDSTRHSTYKTIIDVYGTAMDAYVRFFPPLIRFSSGLEHPVDLLLSEMKSFTNLIWLLITGKWGYYQNRGHFVLLNQYIDWILEKGEYPLELTSVIPTLRLLDDIQERSQLAHKVIAMGMGKSQS